MEEIHTYLHCKLCLDRGQVARLEVGLAHDGLLVACKKHGLVALVTPQKLADWLGAPPPCEVPGCTHDGHHDRKKNVGKEGRP